MTGSTDQVPDTGQDAELKLLAATCAALFSDYAADQGGSWNEPLWRALQDAGIPLISVPEAAGGSGGSLEQAAAVVSAAGAHAARVPLAETCLLGGWLLAEARLPVPPGPLTVAATGVAEPGGAGAAPAPDGFSATRVPGGWRLRGRLPRLGWGRMAERVAVLAAADGTQTVFALGPGDVTVEPGRNVAGEPRDDLVVDTVLDQAAAAPVAVGTGAVLVRRAALARILLIAGAMARTLDLTVRYAGEREQFGRAIGNFQVVQHQVAELAAETAAVRSAADAALRRCAADGFADPQAWFAVAVAKVQAARGATVAGRIAHQVHGAIGFTEEHSLRLSTTRLWAWRDEAGAASGWAAELGRQVLAGGPLWPAVSQEG